jgi:hypothetical protein
MSKLYNKRVRRIPRTRGFTEDTIDDILATHNRRRKQVSVLKLKYLITGLWREGNANRKSDYGTKIHDTRKKCKQGMAATKSKK